MHRNWWQWRPRSVSLDHFFPVSALDLDVGKALPPLTPAIPPWVVPILHPSTDATPAFVGAFLHFMFVQVGLSHGWRQSGCGTPSPELLRNFRVGRNSLCSVMLGDHENLLFLWDLLKNH